jgi:hypothetical protein
MTTMSTEHHSQPEEQARPAAPLPIHGLELTPPDLTADDLLPRSAAWEQVADPRSLAGLIADPASDPSATILDVMCGAESRMPGSLGPSLRAFGLGYIRDFARAPSPQHARDKVVMMGRLAMRGVTIPDKALDEAAEFARSCTDPQMRAQVEGALLAISPGRVTRLTADSSIDEALRYTRDLADLSRRGAVISDQSLDAIVVLGATRAGPAQRAEIEALLEMISPKHAERLRDGSAPSERKEERPDSARPVSSESLVERRTRSALRSARGATTADLSEAAPTPSPAPARR